MTTFRVAIHRDKLIGYLLNISHPRGASKARFFLKHWFSPDEPQQLAEALITVALSKAPGVVTNTQWGERHAIVGPLMCPDGTSPNMLTIWEIPHGETTAVFVTAYPG